MSVINLEKHYFLTLAQDIKDICKPFFDAFNIRDFTHTRRYKDGSLIIFTTQPKSTEYAYKNNLNKQKWHFTKTFQPFETDYTIWKKFDSSSYKYSAIREVMECRFKLFHGLTISDAYEDWVDIYTFSTEKKYTEVNILYENNPEVFRRFIQYFKEKSQKLLLSAQSKKIFSSTAETIITKQVNDYSLETIMPIKRYYVKDTYLTQKELDCIHLSYLGKTIDEIVQILKISRNTIKMHIKNVKRKLGCRKIVDVVRVLIYHKII